MSVDLLREEIERSKYILNLEDNWDGENSPKYSFSLWKEITDELLRIYVNFEKEDIPLCIPSPKIYHAEDGTIELLWNSGILVNISYNGSVCVIDYAFSKGQDNKGPFHKFHGRTRLDKLEDILRAIFFTLITI